MHCVVGQLGLFLCGFLFGFKVFFRWFAVLILHWFNHEEPALFAVMFIAPQFIKPFLEPQPRESSMGVFKPIEPLNSISLEVYGSDLHPCGIGNSVELKIVLHAQDPSGRVSFFPSWEVNLHVWIVGIRGDVSMLLRIISDLKSLHALLHTVALTLLSPLPLLLLHYSYAIPCFLFSIGSYNCRTPTAVARSNNRCSALPLLPALDARVVA
ncbi:hypothetical protein B296_00001105 [Ensete ventricosum]|uniref:Uncharacterized protein n=1 Tax=Ensete ventricosum TaxID=4639 RepID=A0A426Z8Y0_ENSVE|nr:hypothetical protein B296_00001105 [Ensete ventricosum]